MRKKSAFIKADNNNYFFYFWKIWYSQISDKVSEPKSRKALPHTGTSKIAIQTLTLAIHNQGVTQQADVAYELAQKY